MRRSLDSRWSLGMTTWVANRTINTYFQANDCHIIKILL